MNNLVACALLPHPPIMVPEIGKEELATMKSTVEAVQQAAQCIKNSNPQTIIVITPHGPVFQDAVTVSIHPRMKGNLAQFGAPEVVLGYETDGLLVDSIIKQAERLGINLLQLTDEVAKTYRLQVKLDHGALVPLYYMNQAGFKGQLVHITIGMLSYEELYTFGKAVQAAVGAVDKRVAVIASGDLSHRLIPGAPAGYSPRGREFDEKLLAALKELNVKALFNLERDLVEEAGECGLRPVCCLLGIWGGLAAKARVLSYEGPYGVGYGVVTIEPCSSDKSVNDVSGEKQLIAGEVHPTVKLAAESLRHYLAHGSMLAVPSEFPPELRRPAGVFVSLKKQGKLRGCIGTFLPAQENIAAEIIVNAVSAGTRDSRFPPVKPNELNELSISVDVLEEPEQVDSLERLDPQKYGVIVMNGSRSGLLLPMLDGVNTAEEQVTIAMEKAGIAPAELIDLYRFTVTRYH